MPNTRVRTRRKKDGQPRFYATPEGERLNVGAICERYGISQTNFWNRQKKG